MIRLTREEAVFVLQLDASENRFSPDVVAELNARLDEVEKADGAKALVTTGTGKFYSNGLDLDFMMKQERDGAERYLASVLGVLGRVLTFPCFTVAAVNGHAFGAGAQLMLAHDLRLMRADRGFFCMPEADMKVPLHPGMTAILRARLPIQTAHEVIVTSRRYGGEAAASCGIAERALPELPEAELLPAAIAAAAEMAGKAHPVQHQLKRGLYAPVLEALSRPLSALGT
jgi:enoyl-CoA hydratase/carnithine racemase